MLRATVRLILSSAILCGVAVSTFGWDETGHKITGYIAWQTMTPEVRERVVKVLLAAPEDSDIATFYMTYGTRSEAVRKREYFMFMTTWADVIRDRNFEVRSRKYHRSNWHYSDKFWRRNGDQIEYLPAPEDGGLALERLVEFDRTIRGTGKDADKAVAIAWILHLIGDLHQPLHTSARVTETEPKGDQGGNLFLLTPRGTPRDKQENLHWFWDSIVMRNEPNSKDECDAEYIDPIARAIMKEHPYASVLGRLDRGMFENWIKDSLTLAQTDVFSADLKRWEMPSERYKKKAFKLAMHRLAMAGYRMGELLNDAFAGKPPVSAAPTL